MSTSMIEQLKARKAAEAIKALAAGAIPLEQDPSKGIPPIATGMQSSVEAAGPQSGFRSTASLPAPISGVDRSQVPEGAYIALNLNQVVLANGQLVTPVNGYYDPAAYPAGVAAMLVHELEYHAKSWGMVEKV